MLYISATDEVPYETIENMDYNTVYFIMTNKQ